MSEASNRRLTGDDFKKVELPILHKCYHLSWAYRGAVFQLIEINGTKGKVQAPKNPNKKAFDINLADLRETKN